MRRCITIPIVIKRSSISIRSEEPNSVKRGQFFGNLKKTSTGKAEKKTHYKYFKHFRDERREGDFIFCYNYQPRVINIRKFKGTPFQKIILICLNFQIKMKTNIFHTTFPNNQIINEHDEIFGWGKEKPQMQKKSIFYSISH